MSQGRKATKFLPALVSAAAKQRKDFLAPFLSLLPVHLSTITETPAQHVACAGLHESLSCSVTDVQVRYCYSYSTVWIITSN